MEEDIYLHKLNLRNVKPTAIRLLILRTMMEMNRAVPPPDSCHRRWLGRTEICGMQRRLHLFGERPARTFLLRRMPSRFLLPEPGGSGGASTGRICPARSELCTQGTVPGMCGPTGSGLTKWQFFTPFDLYFYGQTGGKCTCFFHVFKHSHVVSHVF